MRRRDFLKTAATTSVVTMIGQASAVAQSWPTKPVKLVVSFPAGGATDLDERGQGADRAPVDLVALRV